MASVSGVPSGALTDEQLKRLDEIMKAQTTARQAAGKKDLDKDQFINILMTQLQHQDPMNPLEDKDFIAQMAQFSSLEQLTNMNTAITKLTTTVESGNGTITKMNTSIESLIEQIKAMNTGVTDGQKKQLESIQAEANEIHEFINLLKAEAAYQ